MVQVNATGHPKQTLPPGCQEWENDIGRPITNYQITFRFESADYGSFQQRVVFDFDEQPYVFRQLGVVVAPELNLLHTIHYPAICEDDSELSWLSKYTVVPFDPQDTQGTVLLGDHVYWQISSRIGLAMFLMCLVKVGAILFELLRPKLKRSYQKEFFFYFSLYIVY